MMVWSISASPLIMGNDLRNVSDASRAILLNEHAIAVNQDPLGQMGTRLSTDLGVQLWARNLADGDIAVGLFNNGTAAAASVCFQVVEQSAESSIYIIEKPGSSMRPRNAGTCISPWPMGGGRDSENEMPFSSLFAGLDLFLRPNPLVRPRECVRHLG